MFSYPLWLAWLLYALVLVSYYLLKPKPGRLLLWPLPLALLLSLLLYVGYIDLIGVLVLLSLALLCWLSHHHQPVIKRLALWLAMTLFLLMGMHMVPGFDNPQILDQQQVKTDSLPFTLYINFDKGLAGLLLLLMVVLPKTEKPAAGWWWQLISIGAGLATLLLGLAWLLRLVQWHNELLLGWSFWWLFLINQIMFVALAEEVFFRGVIQTALQNWLRPKHPWGVYLAILITAVLFGAAHFAGGVGMVVAATVAGLGYGLVYLKTARIEAAIAVHVLVNMLHLTGFSYPLLSP